MKEKYKSFCDAIKRLDEALGAKATALNMDATIQRFEFTYELAWNTLKKVLLGMGIECLNPRDCIRAAFQQKIIADKAENIWLEMMKDRNTTSHVYDKKEAKKIYHKIKKKYFLEFNKLKDKLTLHINKANKKGKFDIRKDPLFSIIGMCETGNKDASENLDVYLYGKKRK